MSGIGAGLLAGVTGGVQSVGSTVSLLGRHGSGLDGAGGGRPRELSSVRSSFRQTMLQRAAVVLEFGARYVRAGLGGEWSPRICIDAPVSGSAVPALHWLLWFWFGPACVSAPPPATGMC